jgi:hypothetical protein
MMVENNRTSSCRANRAMNLSCFAIETKSVRRSHRVSLSSGSEEPPFSSPPFKDEINLDECACD